MRIKDFKKLPLDVKTNYIWDCGVCLHQELIDPTSMKCIFNVNGFFVEALYSANDNGIKAIEPFQDYYSWEGYVDRQVNYLLRLN